MLYELRKAYKEGPHRQTIGSSSPIWFIRTGGCFPEPQFFPSWPGIVLSCLLHGKPNLVPIQQQPFPEHHLHLPLETPIEIGFVSCTPQEQWPWSQALTAGLQQNSHLVHAKIRRKLECQTFMWSTCSTKTVSTMSLPRGEKAATVALFFPEKLFLK